MRTILAIAAVLLVSLVTDSAVSNAASLGVPTLPSTSDVTGTVDNTVHTVTAPAPPLPAAGDQHGQEGHEPHQHGVQPDPHGDKPCSHRHRSGHPAGEDDRRRDHQAGHHGAIGHRPLFLAWIWNAGRVTPDR